MIGYLIFLCAGVQTSVMNENMINNDGNPLMINGINGWMIIFQRLID